MCEWNLQKPIIFSHFCIQEIPTERCSFIDCIHTRVAPEAHIMQKILLFLQISSQPQKFSY